jgi:AcrR family transcriptional regulator
MTARPVPLEPKQQRSAETRQRLLDAAVEELLESGHAGLTTGSVAMRARVSRGAQQHHFPRRDVLLAEAVRHLAARQLDELGERVAATPRGRARVRKALDVIYAQYSGPLFAATLELTLAARHDPELAALTREHEREVSRSISDKAAEIFDDDTRAAKGFAELWAMTLGTARGIALLRLLGHPADVVDRQWAFARDRLLAQFAV